MSILQRRQFLVTAATATAVGAGTSAVGATGPRPRRHPAWERTLGGETMGAFGDARRLGDGYLLVGTARDDSYGTDGWAVKLSPDGDPEWERRYRSAAHRQFLEREVGTGPEPRDGLEFVLPADDGHLLVGWTYYDGPATFVGWLVRIDDRGERRWERSLGTLEDASAYSFLADGVRTEDGYLLCGIESPGIMLGGGGWLVAVDDAGAVNWHRRYPATERDLEGTGLRDTFRAVVETDRGYLLAGDYEPRNGGPSRAWLVGVDPDGRVRWEDDFQLREGATNRVYDLEPTDYGYVAVGAAGEPAPLEDAFLYDGGIDGDGFVTAYTDAGERRWFREREGIPMYCTHTGSKGVVCGGSRDGRGWVGTVERTDLEADRASVVTSLAEAHGGEFVAAGRTTGDAVEGWVRRFDGYDGEGSSGSGADEESDGVDGGDDNDGGGGDANEEGDRETRGEDDREETRDEDGESRAGESDETDGREGDGGGDEEGNDSGEARIEFLDCRTVRFVGDAADTIVGVVWWDENEVVGTIKEPTGPVEGERTIDVAEEYFEAPAGPIATYAEAFEEGTAVVPGNGDRSRQHPDYDDCEAAALEGLEGETSTTDATTEGASESDDSGTPDGSDGADADEANGDDGAATESTTATETAPGTETGSDGSSSENGSNLETTDESTPGESTTDSAGESTDSAGESTVTATETGTPTNGGGEETEGGNAAVSSETGSWSRTDRVVGGLAAAGGVGSVLAYGASRLTDGGELRYDSGRRKGEE